MNCINCYHYDACASVDVTGYVANIEHEDECEHFKTVEDVHPTGHWVRTVTDLGNDHVFVEYHCSRCGVNSARNIKSFTPEDWYGYYKDRYVPEPYYMRDYCPECGAQMNLEKTDHSNRYVRRNREKED